MHMFLGKAEIISVSKYRFVKFNEENKTTLIVARSFTIWYIFSWNFEFCKSSINYKDEIHFVIMCPLYNKICEKILLENTVRLENLSKNVQDYAELFKLGISLTKLEMNRLFNLFACHIFIFNYHLRAIFLSLIFIFVFNCDNINQIKNYIIS